METKAILTELLKECLETKDIVKRIELVQYINRILPAKYKIEIPTFVTNALIDKKLFLLQDAVEGAT